LRTSPLGQTYGSGRIRIDGDRIKSFAAEFDPQPFHLDEETARDSIFRGLAASGWHTAALSLGPIGLAGLVGLIFSLLYWNGKKFGQLNYEHSLRLMIPSVTALIVSCQVILGTFFLSILGIKHTRHPVIVSPPSVRDDALDHREQPAAAPRL